MDLTHLHAFLDAMQRKDIEAMLTHMTDDIRLETPLHVEPFNGKAAVRSVVGPLLGVVDAFEFREIMQGPQHASVFFGVTVGAVELDGMDYVRLDAAGLLQELTVLWRPLPSVMVVHGKLA